MVVPESHVRTVERLAQNMFICAPHVAQIAALGAMEAESELSKNFAIYANNRLLMLEALPKMASTKLHRLMARFMFMRMYHAGAMTVLLFLRKF